MTLGLIPNDENAFDDESLETYRRSLKCLLWAHHAAELALQWPVDELAGELAGDPDYANKILGIYPMLRVERSSAAYRDAVAAQMLDHVRAALLLGGVDLSEDRLRTPINYAALPQFPGIEACEVDGLVLDLKILPWGEAG